MKYLLTPSGSTPPNPVVLPTGSADEFVELYNAGTRSINIENFDLSGGTIGAFVLAPNAYVILTATSKTGEFAAFGDVIGVTSWNGLTNSGETITLTDNLSNLVDSLTYDQDWYHDSDKDDGAWTIEQINPELSCGAYEGNWAASTDNKGGTPGAQNSTYDNNADIAGPSVVSMTALDNNTFRFTFNEPMDGTSLTGGTYAFDNGLTQTSITTVFGLLSVDVDLNNTLVSGTTYQATISGVKDCSGNSISTSVISLDYDILAPTINRVIVKSLTEIQVLFDEALTESIAEKESNFSVNNGIGNPSSAILDTDNNQDVSLKFSTALVPEQTNTLTITNLEDLNNNAIIGNLEFDFTYTQDIDTTLALGVNLLDVNFNTDLEETAAETLSNYFVSGGAGNPVLATLDETDKSLVHIIFSNDFDENSELTLTIENQKNTLDAFLSTPEYTFIYDTDAPVLESLTVQNSTQILLSFDEVLEKNSAETANNYSYSTLFPTTSILQSNEKSVLLIFGDDFNREQLFTLNISGIRDVFENTLSKTIQEDFIYDVFPPELDSLIVTSPTILEVIFNENVDQVSSEILSNYVLDHSVGSPIKATQNLEFKNKVLLEFGSAIPSVDGLVLSINNISDSRANVIATEQQITFDYGKISIGNLIAKSQETIQVTFNKTPNIALASDASNYMVNGQTILSSVEDHTNDKIYILTLTESVSDYSEHTLNIVNIVDLSGNGLEINDFTFEFNSQFKAYELISNNTLEIEFNLNLDATSAGTLINYDLSPDLGNPAVVTLDDNLVRMVFANDFVVNTDYTLTWSSILNEFNNVLPTFSIVFNIDNTAPYATEIETIFNNLLTLKFDEALKESTAENESLFFVDNNIGNPKLATYNSNDSTVLLEFSNTFSESINYIINIDRVEDLSANQINNQQLSFSYTAPLMPEASELIITEIMANPSPVIGLPEQEYIEIYNNSTKTFNLSVVNLSDNTNTVNLGNKDIASGEYLILTSDASAFTGFENVFDVSGFPTLTNSGETISLSNTNSVILDKVAFETSFYRDNSKDDGGYSLERIFFAEQCVQSLNWIASTDASGGTPGKENSVFNINFDSTAPEITAVNLNGTNGITIHFDEVLDSLSLKNGTYSFTNGLIIQNIVASNAGVDSVLINFTTDIEAGIIYEVTISNVSDCSSNTIVEVTKDFGIGKTPVYGDLLFTEIMPDPSPVVGLPEEEFIEIYNTSSSLINLEGIQLADASDTTTLGSYNLLPNNYLILSSTANTNDFSAFGNTLGVSSFPSLGNTVDSLYLFLNDNTLIDQLFYTSDFYRNNAKDDGGYSLERIFFAEQCVQSLNWIASTDASGGTPGNENSVFNINFDSTAPEITAVNLNGTNGITIHFDEVLDSLSLENGTYSFTNGLAIQNVAVSDAGVDSVHVNFTTNIEAGIIYEVTISNISDCSSNTIVEVTKDFGIGKTPIYGDLLFTEIMPDPSPVVGLPEEEFIEIYNTSSSLINLEGIQLADASDTTTLGSYNLLPNNYLILSSTANTNDFSAFGNTLGVSSFPSLGNTVDSLYLFLNDNTLLDQLFYSSSFYRDDSKDDGGYSLERIFFDEQCVQSLNWIASTDAGGGTPSKENSVFNGVIDTDLPEFLSFEIIKNLSLKVLFSEPMDSLSLVEGTYVITGDIVLNDLSGITKGGQEVVLNFVTEFDAGIIYNVEISNISDCSGIVINPFNIEFGFSEKPKFNELIITEIMADPDADAGSSVSLPAVEYLELYNTTNKSLDLSGLTLQDGISQTTLNPYILPSQQYVLLVPRGSESLYADKPVLSVSSWPSLNNGGEVLAIFNQNTLVFSLTYSSEWYKDSDKTGGGYSMEMIDPKNPCGDINNWSASTDVRGGTPGELNSVDADNPDNFGPQLTEAIVSNEAELHLVFNEKLSPSSIFNGLVTLDPGISISAITNDTLEIKSLRAQLSSSLSTNQTYTIKVDGFSDCLGNIIDTDNNSTTFLLPEAANEKDVILNEILFNPRSGGTDFVEIYNNSTKAINLKKWQVSSIDDNGTLIPKTITNNDVVINPSEYKVLTTDFAKVKDHYPAANEATFLLVSTLSSMPNDEGTVIILDSLENQIDRFDYSADFHFNLLDDVKGVSLERINFNAETNNANSWQSAASTAGFATPGLANSQFKTETQTTGTLTVEPKVFVPDNTGMDNFTTINYDLKNSGSFANILIYNHRGKLTKTIAQGDLLSTTGFFTWDGTNNAGERASFGYYVIYFEIYDSSGNTEVMKETIVLGTRF